MKVCNRCILFLLLLFTGRSLLAQSKAAKNFPFTIKHFKTDTTIKYAVLYKDNIVLLRHDQRLLVIDEHFRPVNTLTKNFSGQQFNFIHRYNDTVFLSSEAGLFYLNDSFNLNKYSGQPFRKGLPFYVDDEYYVDACARGEWGGTVFFLNKRTGKTYAQLAIGVQQVAKYHNQFVITNYRAHMGGTSVYNTVADPTLLYELTKEKPDFFCTWAEHYDSIRDASLFIAEKEGVNYYYADTVTTRNLATFLHRDTLYSIYCTDSATILGRHEGNKVTRIKKLLNRPVDFGEANTSSFNNKILTAYNDGWIMYDDKNREKRYQSSGFLFVNNGKITLVEFDLPNKYKKNGKLR